MGFGIVQLIPPGGFLSGDWLVAPESRPITGLLGEQEKWMVFYCTILFPEKSSPESPEQWWYLFGSWTAQPTPEDPCVFPESTDLAASHTLKLGHSIFPGPGDQKASELWIQKKTREVKLF